LALLASGGANGIHFRELVMNNLVADFKTHPLIACALQKALQLLQLLQTGKKIRKNAHF
jgi:hypothetical protein